MNQKLQDVLLGCKKELQLQNNAIASDSEQAKFRERENVSEHSDVLLITRSYR